MTEAGAVWIVEDGIGETRAALVVNGVILEAEVELPGTVRAGTLSPGRLASIIAPGRIGLVVLEGSGEVLLQPLPRGLPEGATLLVEVTREALGHKRPLCRSAPAGSMAGEGPDLESRICATELPITRNAAHGPDALEAAGWSELIEEASTGTIPFAGGGLLMSLTPAMTLFDVDGTLDPATLCVAGAAAAGRAVRRLGITGSIGVDLPTVGDRAVRQAAADALDATLPPPFERTAVNGFGFVQIVRPQKRASLPQTLAADRVGAAARGLLRSAERAPGHGRRMLTAHPLVVVRLEQEVGWLRELERRIGAPVALRPSAAFSIPGAHVQAEHL